MKKIPIQKKRAEYPARNKSKSECVEEAAGYYLCDKTNVPQRPVISLFSGAMGMDLGLAQAGLTPVVCQDIDPWCCETIRKNKPGLAVVPGDIKSLIAADPSCSFLTKAAGIDAKDVFAIVGGPPCQAYSTAGRRQGSNDIRGTLYADFVHTVEQLRPRFFVMENVKGLLSMRIDPENPESTPLLEIILSEFARIGYHTVHGVLDAVHYGAAQFRERVVIVGSRDAESIFLPLPTRYPTHQSPGCRWKTLRDAIGDLEDEPGPCAKFSPKIQYYLGMVPEGGNWKNLPAEILPEAMGGAYASGGGKVGFFRRLGYSQPAPTMVTSPIQKATILCHPCGKRPLSAREYARIQGFPDDWNQIGRASCRERVYVLV